MFKQIIAKSNLKLAYLELYERFLLQCKTARYSGHDNCTIDQVEPFLDEMLDLAHYELTNLITPKPAQYHSIPKPNGGTREIYLLPISERIKLQAIYRHLEPFIDKQISNHVYSYRSARTVYHALRSTRRFYFKNYNQNYWVYKTDISDYANQVDHQIFLERMEQMGVDKQTLGLIELYLKNTLIKNGEIIEPQKGILQGSTLASLVYNAYVKDLDFQISKQVDFYRRVGDDMLIIHHNKNELAQTIEQINQFIEDSRLELKPSKTIFQPITEPFDYLGLQFEKGKISIPPQKVRKLIDKIKKMVAAKQNLKLQKLQSVLQIKSSGWSQYFLSYLFAYNLVTDYQQLKSISRHINNILAVALGGGHTWAKLRKGYAKLHQIRFKSFFQHFKKITKL